MHMKSGRRVLCVYTVEQTPTKKRTRPTQDEISRGGPVRDPNDRRLGCSGAECCRCRRVLRSLCARSNDDDVDDDAMRARREDLLCINSNTYVYIYIFCNDMLLCANDALCRTTTTPTTNKSKSRVVCARINRPDRTICTRLQRYPLKTERSRYSIYLYFISNIYWHNKYKV